MLRVGSAVSLLLLVGVEGCSPGPATGAGQPAPSPSNLTRDTPAMRALGTPEIEKALPTVNDVQPRWQLRTAADLTDERGHDTKSGRLGLGTVRYRADDLQGLVTFCDRVVPGHGDGARRPRPGPHRQRPGIPGRLGRRGNKQPCQALIQLRVGTAIVVVSIDTDGPTAPDPRLLNSAARMTVERVRQTQRGHTPTAKTA